MSEVIAQNNVRLLWHSTCTKQ